MIHVRQSVRRRSPPQEAAGRGRPWLFLVSLLVLAVSGCGDSGTTPPGTLRFGQFGSAEVTLEVPLRLGQGELIQRVEWASSGLWTRYEAIRYRGLTGDESESRAPGDPAAFAAGYASFITQVNEVKGLELFVPDLSQELEPECGVTRTRITLVIRDDSRGEEARWIRCADGSLANLTPVGAGPDPAASRVVAATQSLRDGTVGENFVSVYAGSVPFGELDRGDDTSSSLRSPAVYTDETEWKAFWNEHAPTRPLPSVSFDEEMVVVAIVGVRGEAGDSVEVRRILQVDDGTLTEVFERIPGDFCSPAARTHVPFHIVVAPRTPEPLRFADVRIERVACGS
ncbi:MAG: hypothetical protein ACE5GJ_07670 [Gemmatimonadota bacterium]